MAVLLDTGILLRLWDKSDPQHEAIASGLRTLYRQGTELTTTAQNIAEFWNVATRPASARGGYGRSIEDTSRRVQFFERFGRILSDNADTYAEWRRLVVQYRVSGVAVHDARIVAQMMVLGIQEILTLNVDDFRRYSMIKVLTPDTTTAEESK